ncbi:aminotransferase class V-fold PLP-dependent enzyme [Marivirga tractuosa]|uniref:aminotransferase class V-fold PLP-dependent enzyme n=1 Tax=Marivirga tractuosa TaxID=1006 RepID=UPI0035CFB961
MKSLSKSKKGEHEIQELSHDEFFNQLRQKEYDRLDKEKHVYLDYTGGNLYSKSQLEQHFKMLSEHTFGNPHSTNPTSKISTALVEEARESVLKFFNASDYYCIFTQNASMALQIVGESYPFEKNGHFLHCVDNHNSVIGIREYCTRNGGSHEFFPINFDDLSISDEALLEKLTKSKGDNKLLAYPAQSNVSGVKHDLNYIKIAQELGWDVLLDAAAFVPTSVLDLSNYKPDYVTASFYKIFGFPTGIGCLLVKKSSFEKLQKKWFAGGTVRLSSAQTPFFFLIDNHERFENGTINYLGIPAVKTGLEYIQDIGMNRINDRVDSLMKYLHKNLKSLKHSNGTNQLNIYGPDKRENCGGTIIMNFHNPDGSKIWFEKIEEIANSKKISVRTGCFCNPGIDEINYHLTIDELSDCYTSVNKDNVKDLRDSLEKMRGAIRVSVGLATNQKDLDTFISFVKELKDKTIVNTES